MAWCIYLLFHSPAFDSIRSLPYRCILTIGYVKPCNINNSTWKSKVLLFASCKWVFCFETKYNIKNSSSPPFAQGWLNGTLYLSAYVESGSLGPATRGPS